MTARLGKLASQTGLFPQFRKRAGQPGEVLHVPPRAKRPPVERFLAAQRRFHHLIDGEPEAPRIIAGREAEVAAIQAYADRNVERLLRWAAWDTERSAS